MRICGIEITGSTANLAIVSNNHNGDATYHPCVTRKLDLGNEKDAAELRSFMKSIRSFLHENAVERICIKQRALTGARGGGGVSFKIEALIQIASDVDVVFANSNALAKFAKGNLAGLPIDMPAFLKKSYLCGAFDLNRQGLI